MLDPSVTVSLNVLTWARWVAEGYGVENECIMGSPRDGGTPPAFWTDGGERGVDDGKK